MQTLYQSENCRVRWKIIATTPICFVSGSFDPDTPIWIDERTSIRIADLKAGEQVLARGAADVFYNCFGRLHLRPGFRLRRRLVLSHLRSPLDYDEPEILHCPSHAICPMSADVGQGWNGLLNSNYIRAKTFGLVNIKAGPPPYYGEDAYSARNIDFGYTIGCASKCPGP